MSPSPSPSRSSSPSEETPRTKQARWLRTLDEDDELPIRPAAGTKRASEDIEDDEQDNDEPPTGPSTAVVPSARSGTLVDLATRLAKRQKLDPHKAADLEAFAKDDLATRQVKLYALQLGLGQKFGDMQTAAPAFEVSTDLNKHLARLTKKVFISLNVGSYNGNALTVPALNLLKIFRYGVPVGLEFQPSWNLKIEPNVQNHATQLRSQFKKIIKKSVEDAEKRKHTNIFTLSGKFVKDTGTAVTVEFCARVAIWRDVYTERQNAIEQHEKGKPAPVVAEEDKEFQILHSDTLWEAVDKRLKWMRKTTMADKDKMARMARQVLLDDKKSHGDSTTYKLPDESSEVDEQQQTIDNEVAAVSGA